MSETLFYVLRDSCFGIEDLDVTKVNVYDVIFCRAAAKENGEIPMVATVSVFAGKTPNVFLMQTSCCIFWRMSVTV